MTSPPRELVASALAVGAALLAASTVPDGSAGLAVMLVGWAVIAAVVVRRGRDMDRPELGFLAAAALLSAAFIFRSAEWLLALDAMAAGALAVSAARPVSTWRSMVTAPVATLRAVPRGVNYVLRPWLSWIGGVSERRGTVLRAAAIVCLLVGVFGALFVSADAAFASLAERLLLSEIDLGLLPARIALGLFVIAGCGALLVLDGIEISPSPWTWTGRGAKFRLQPGEWISGLVAIDVLFAAFVFVQIGVLFGGHTRVLETAGLTYAQYAREGFFQLLVVAVLTLGVIAIVARFGDLGSAGRRWMQVLMGLLCVLTLVVLASAFTRMNLYQEAFGYTQLRIMVDLTILWLGAVFAFVMVAGIRWKAEWLPRVVIALAAVAILGLNVFNPDARIASLNIARAERTGDVDLLLLGELSPDAASALTELPEPARSCVAASIQGRLDTERSLWSFNLAREKARRLLEDPASAEEPSHLLGCSMARLKFPAGGQSGLRKGS